MAMDLELTAPERCLLSAITIDLARSLITPDPEFTTGSPEFDALVARTRLEICLDFLGDLAAAGARPISPSHSVLLGPVLAGHLLRMLDLEVTEELEEQLVEPATEVRSLIHHAAHSLDADLSPHVPDSAQRAAALARWLGSRWTTTASLRPEPQAR